jgi:hypothetical protein
LQTRSKSRTLLGLAECRKTVWCTRCLPQPRDYPRHSSAVGGELWRPNATKPRAVTTEDGYLQLELRRYIRRDGSARERGPYWYFQYHEGGKRKKLYLGKTSDPEGTLAAKRANPLRE